MSKTEFRETGCEDGGVDGTGLDSCPLTRFDIKSVELRGYTTRELGIWQGGSSRFVL
jgi:hypothetical protein